MPPSLPIDRSGFFPVFVSLPLSGADHEGFDSVMEMADTVLEDIVDGSIGGSSIGGEWEAICSNDVHMSVTRRIVWLRRVAVDAAFKSLRRIATRHSPIVAHASGVEVFTGHLASDLGSEALRSTTDGAFIKARSQTSDDLPCSYLVFPLQLQARAWLALRQEVFSSLRSLVIPADLGEFDRHHEAPEQLSGQSPAYKYRDHLSIARSSVACGPQVVIKPSPSTSCTVTFRQLCIQAGNKNVSYSLGQS